uniref:Glutaminyl-peptide cyclotransferase n=1 Tax=Taeniopygia guttata TaxID=59729 RepID=A0A674GV05_TAEGU|nr:glutaminyl-peptide cyclotransferase-like protein [Taeniopygia guttata]
MRQVPAGPRRARAAGSSPAPAPGPLPVPVPGPGPSRGLLPRPPRPARPLLPLLALLAAAAVLFLSWPGGERGTAGPDPPKSLRDPGPPSERALRTLLAHLDPARLWGSLLRPLLHERLPGGPGSRAARQHIVSHLRSLGARWHLELDTFVAPTPRGPVAFSSVVATVAPVASRRLALGCHYDTKALPGGTFVGATDAAVPCALLLELAAALDGHLRERGEQDPALTLQLLFLDGEEAFEAWSDSDSLYGARHLAAKMAARGHPAGSEVTAMSLLVLLDLLGAARPAIHSHFPESHRWFLRLATIEQRLRRLGLLYSAPPEPPFFRLEPPPGPVEDDHLPFLRRGVPVLHLIPTPFPRVWHTPGDTEANLHPPTVQDLAKVLLVFVAEFLQL